MRGRNADRLSEPIPGAAFGRNGLEKPHRCIDVVEPAGPAAPRRAQSVRLDCLGNPNGPAAPFLGKVGATSRRSHRLATLRFQPRSARGRPLLSPGQRRCGARLDLRPHGGAPGIAPAAICASNHLALAT